MKPASYPLIGDVPLDSILAEGNIRDHRGNDEQAKSLLNSVRAVGVLEPLLITGLPKGSRANGYRFQLVSGFRRYTAACQAGLDRVPCRVLKTLTPAQVLEIRLTENLQRQEMNPIEEAKAIKELLKVSGIDQRTAALRLGKSEGWVSIRLGFLKLPEEIQLRLAEGKISDYCARLLVPHAENPEARETILKLSRIAYELSGQQFHHRLTVALKGRWPHPHSGGPRSQSACDCACPCCLVRIHEVRSLVEAAR
ncbi:MAG TPA: ParB/RepB/Spo0J family partition protein [Thermoplasmata archaeon]|nr:ParB/RepB/Spo0J family partition protein [Thermoplasmata archaeon]